MFFYNTNKNVFKLQFEDLKCYGAGVKQLHKIADQIENRGFRSLCRNSFILKH